PGEARWIDLVVEDTVLRVRTADVEGVRIVVLAALDRLDADGVVLAGVDVGADRLHDRGFTFEVVAVARQLTGDVELDAEQLTGERDFPNGRDVPLVELGRIALAGLVVQRQAGRSSLDRPSDRLPLGQRQVEVGLLPARNAQATARAHRAEVLVRADGGRAVAAVPVGVHDVAHHLGQELRSVGELNDRVDRSTRAICVRGAQDPLRQIAGPAGEVAATLTVRVAGAGDVWRQAAE